MRPTHPVALSASSYKSNVKQEKLEMAQQWTPPPPPTSTPANVPNYLIPAILVTLFCCLPTGVVSIIFSTQVNSKVAAGDVAGAMESSKKAKTWMMVSIGLGVLAWIIAIVVNVIGFVASSR
jgi:Interferon-induced transmembrane protein